MAADFKAFSYSTVLSNWQKRIETLEVWDSNLLAGLVDGTLVVLREDSKNPCGPWQVTQTYKNLAQKYIAQLQVAFSLLLPVYLTDQLPVLCKSIRDFSIDIMSRPVLLCM